MSVGRLKARLTSGDASHQTFGPLTDAQLLCRRHNAGALASPCAPTRTVRSTQRCSVNDLAHDARRTTHDARRTTHDARRSASSTKHTGDQGQPDSMRLRVSDFVPTRLSTWFPTHVFHLGPDAHPTWFPTRAFYLVPTPSLHRCTREL